MQSKWLDVGSTMAAFHYQSKAYEEIQPPSYGDHPEINDSVRGRESTPFSSEGQTEQFTSNGESSKSKQLKIPNLLKRNKKMKEGTTDKTERDALMRYARSIYAVSSPPTKIPRPKTRNRRSLSPTELSQTDGEVSAASIVSGTMKQTVPSVFLQEAAHLVSLLSAVALSTLRNDIEGVDAPLTEFIPGNPWPAFNSDTDPNIKHEGICVSKFFGALRFIFDISRTEHQRAIYNVNRPFRVIGGISSGEAAMLQSARGPSAKVALVNMWMNEFIIREHLHGSMGTVAPPIISRLQQYQSDGFLWYNSARKMSYIPLPFPHAQLTVIFLKIFVVIFPVLMISFTEFWSGFVLNFLGLFVLTGLNELSKEMEYPFRNAPNDLPLNLFQAQFNEALLASMFAGHNPDSWWEIKSSA